MLAFLLFYRLQDSRKRWKSILNNVQREVTSHMLTCALKVARACMTNSDFFCFITDLFNAPFTLRRRNLKTVLFTLKTYQMFSVHTTPEYLKTAFSCWKRVKSFPSTLRWRNFKTQQSPVILDLSLRKTCAGESRHYRNVIVYEKLLFKNIFRPT